MPDMARPGLTAGDECGEAGHLLELLDSRPAWHADGACREPHPGATWFPNRGESDVAAKRICATCPARPECAEWAAHQGPDLQGVWGGLSHRQRAAGITTPPVPPPPPPARCRRCRAVSSSLVEDLCADCRRPRAVVVPPPTGPCIQCGDPTAGDRIHRIGEHPLHASPCYQQVRRQAARTGTTPGLVVQRLAAGLDDGRLGCDFRGPVGHCGHRLVTDSP